MSHTHRHHTSRQAWWRRRRGADPSRGPGHATIDTRGAGARGTSPPAGKIGNRPAQTDAARMNMRPSTALEPNHSPRAHDARATVRQIRRHLAQRAPPRRIPLPRATRRRGNCPQTMSCLTLNLVRQGQDTQPHHLWQVAKKREQEERGGRRAPPAEDVTTPMGERDFGNWERARKRRVQKHTEGDG